MRGLPFGGSAKTATAAGGNTATAGWPGVNGTAGIPCQNSPVGVRRTPSDSTVPVTTLTPANRAPKPLRGAPSTSAVAPGLGHPAVLEDQHAVGQRHHVEQVVGDQHRRAAVAREHPAQHRADRRRDGHVEPGHRLVEQQHVGFTGQRPCDRHPLGLPTGQLARFAVGELVGADLPQPVQRPLAGDGLAAAPGARCERDVVGGAQVRKQQRILQQQADPAVVGRDVHPGAGVGEHPVAQPDQAAVGPDAVR